MSALKKFGQASGLEINISKSWLTFPKSLHHRLRKILSHSVHIPATTSFGKYLGIPLVPHKPKNADYEDLLIRFNRRLAGWQTNFINFAGRITLIKHVLSALPVYHMQSTLLPPKILQGMEKIMRRFLWNKCVSRLYLAQISWQRLCLPKNQGGLGIKHLANWNKAFLLKLLWICYQKHPLPWVRPCTCTGVTLRRLRLKLIIPISGGVYCP